MPLATTIFGSDEANPPLLIVHGLFGSARNWGVIAKRLSDTRQVITVDMRNHGESPWFPTHSYPDLADDLMQVIKAHGGRADVLGHSMGGKAAMVLALTQPSLVNRLVVADIAPVVYGHTQAHLIHAMRALDLAQVEKRSDADALLAEEIETPSVRAFLLQSLDVKERRWRLNLDVLETEMPRIIGFPDITGQFNGPALFLSGADSDYVQPGHRPLIKALFPNAVFARIPGAGHWLHAEKPREFEAALRAFLPVSAD
ncbi:MULTISPECIES: alpha/beta fold hydrolase [Actibacterium]|uniref:Pimeloyl-ACP methyl ester carboxylesterase n=1 Tax=Actibacterium naphthalenivorans TaxID=1614693 RepID=A0A840C7G5_9RHOB|nr:MULTISPECIES: alpha/beta fold hydrolase [Actibacterium]MBB4020803.1 pimeloyl-ACP methyl ester carboxylesterase [Actibacterium naphthalenivorans]